MIYSDFSAESAVALRRQAINRVREQQRRARLAMEQPSDAPPPLQPHSPESAPPVGQPFPNQAAGGNPPSQHQQPQNQQQPHRNNTQGQDASGASPNQLLSRLLGGGNVPPPPQGGGRGSAPFGLTDLLRRHGLSEAAGGLGDSVMSKISSVSRPIAGMLEQYGIDGENLIILMVIWLLFSEKEEDKTLLLALGYLLL